MNAHMHWLHSVNLKRFLEVWSLFLYLLVERVNLFLLIRTVFLKVLNLFIHLVVKGVNLFLL